MPTPFAPSRLQVEILWSLRDGPAHGYRIMRAIEGRGTFREGVHPGSLYRAVHGLLGRGMLRPVDGEADARTVRYELTGSGRESVAWERERMRRMLDSLSA